MFKNFIPALLLLLASGAQAQIQIQNGYFPGYYFDNKGNKVAGVIRLNAADDNFSYRPDADGDKQKVKIDEVTSVVVLGDSLVVIGDNNKADKKYFARVLVTTPTVHLYYKTKSARWVGGTPGMVTTASPNMGARGSSPNFTNNYSWKSSAGYAQRNVTPMYLDGNTTLELTNDNYIAVLSKAFADVPDVVRLIENKDLTLKNLDEIVDRYLRKTKFNGMFKDFKNTD